MYTVLEADLVPGPGLGTLAPSLGGSDTQSERGSSDGEGECVCARVPVFVQQDSYPSIFDALILHGYMVKTETTS